MYEMYRVSSMLASTASYSTSAIRSVSDRVCSHTLSRSSGTWIVASVTPSAK